MANNYAVGDKVVYESLRGNVLGKVVATKVSGLGHYSYAKQHIVVRVTSRTHSVYSAGDELLFHEGTAFLRKR